MITDQEIRDLEHRIKNHKTRPTDWQLHRQIINQITAQAKGRGAA